MYACCQVLFPNQVSVILLTTRVKSSFDGVVVLSNSKHRWTE